VSSISRNFLYVLGWLANRFLTDVTRDIAVSNSIACSEEYFSSLFRLLRKSDTTDGGADPAVDSSLSIFRMGNAEGAKEEEGAGGDAAGICS